MKIKNVIKWRKIFGYTFLISLLLSIFFNYVDTEIYFNFAILFIGPSFTGFIITTSIINYKKKYKE